MYRTRICTRPSRGWSEQGVQLRSSALFHGPAGLVLVAQRFQKGRVFIGGDAAHLFTPSGGLGYNTAVEDAVNLSWKLAATLEERFKDLYEANLALIRPDQIVAWRGDPSQSAKSVFKRVLGDE